MQTIMILGRQAGIALAELESLCGAEHVRPVGKIAAVIDGEVDFGRIGGSSKAAEVLDILDSSDWRNVQKHLEYTIPDLLKSLGDGKLSLGLSAYGFDVTAQKIMATGLNIKKVIRLSGRSVRLVPNNEPALNSAQVLHNKLTGPLGWEILLIKDGNKTIIAKTTQEQDIEAYALRDRGRPMRDARIGMLPPKLAQIIINLAIDRNMEYEIRNKGKTKILDPFCGTGVILQETLLMGYDALGSDLEPRLVEYTKKNLEWLQKTVGYKEKVLALETGDATQHQWKERFDTVASETYLGRAFTTPPAPDMLEKNRHDCDTIIRKFLKNIHTQIKPGTRLALAVPAWASPAAPHIPHSISHIPTFLHLPLLDSLGEIGYNRIDFNDDANRQDLIYHRDGQIVGRELIVLTRK